MNPLPLLLLASLLAAPLALAHDPPRPAIECQDTAAERYYHDYGPPSSGLAVFARDGNLANCPRNDPLVLGPLLPNFACNVIGHDKEVVCDGFNTGVEGTILDYDGELEYALGGARLLAWSGDGYSYGSLACYGPDSAGHHGRSVYARSLPFTFGPQFSVTADWSRFSLDVPDCGDGYVEPCDPNPPPPSQEPFPLNVVVDTIKAALYTVFGPGGQACNPYDGKVRFDSVAGGPSGGFVPFEPGSDGSYVVLIEPDTNNGLVSAYGHVWS